MMLFYDSGLNSLKYSRSVKSLGGKKKPWDKKCLLSVFYRSLEWLSTMKELIESEQEDIYQPYEATPTTNGEIPSVNHALEMFCIS